MYYKMLPDEEPLKQFELLYWQGVENPNKWNVYARELRGWLFHNEKRLSEIADAGQIKWADYNVNRMGTDYRYVNPSRIDRLRGHKLNKLPLIVFNYDGPGFLIGSDTEFNQLKRRIEVERKKHGYNVIPYLM